MNNRNVTRERDMRVVRGDEKNEHMKLWNTLCETPEEYTKEVSIGARRFTSIDPYYQIKRATEMWGPFGVDWCVRDENFQFELGGQLLVYTAILHFPHGDTTGAIQLHSSARTQNKNGIDDEVYKKTATDALTKGLSKLGMSADVFLGLFDDSRYLETQEEQKRQARALEAAKSAAKQKKTKDDLTALWCEQSLTWKKTFPPPLYAEIKDFVAELGKELPPVPANESAPADDAPQGQEGAPPAQDAPEQPVGRDGKPITLPPPPQARGRACTEKQRMAIYAIMGRLLQTDTDQAKAVAGKMLRLREPVQSMGDLKAIQASFILDTLKDPELANYFHGMVASDAVEAMDNLQF